MCLQLKFPDHYPDDPYSLEATQAAARFVLHSTTATVRQVTPVMPAAAAAPTAIPAVAVKAKAITLTLIDALAQAIAKVLSTQNMT